MNFGGLWLLVCEDGAHIWPFIMQVHIQDLYTVLCHCCVIQQDHSRVQRPFLTPCEEDSGTVQPSYSWYLAVHIASETQEKIELSHETVHLLVVSFFRTNGLVWNCSNISSSVSKGKIFFFMFWENISLASTKNSIMLYLRISRVRQNLDFSQVSTLVKHCKLSSLDRINFERISDIQCGISKKTVKLFLIFIFISKKKKELAFILLILTTAWPASWPSG